MKNILVPTDFSACAKNATYAAMELAATYRGTLHLCSIIDAPENWNRLSWDEQEKYPEIIQKIQHESCKHFRKYYLLISPLSENPIFDVY